LVFSLLRTDGGGELYGSQTFRSALTQIHVQTKTTGGYNAAANGPPETGGGLIKRTMRCLLVMGGQDPNYWCFAAPFSQTLENIRPRRKEDYRSSHAGIYGKEATYDHLRILFSMVYILVSSASLVVKIHCIEPHQAFFLVIKALVVFSSTVTKQNKSVTLIML
jgi:hypothetical protein